MNSNLKVMTLNAWLLELPVVGLKLAKSISKRMEQLPDHLSSTGADVIFLQEVWRKKFRNKIIKEMEERGYHACYKDNSGWGNFGNGLLTLSKFPFKDDPELFTFKESTRADEKFVRKGVLSVHIEHPTSKNICLLNTHLGATSERNSKQTAKLIRQREELISYIDALKIKNGSAVVLGGDLNFCESFYDGNYVDFINGSELVDTYRDIHTDKSLTSYNGHTFSVDNTFTKSITNKSFVPNRRLDYIFVDQAEGLNTLDSQVIFTNKVGNVHLSDHYAVLSDLSIN
jgi:endonuclease/exonuclease/phosphatase family metal-dependent hydrolase